MDLLERLFNPPWVFSVIPLLIANALYWYWFRPRKRIARERGAKRRAELLAELLDWFLEPELYKALKEEGVPKRRYPVYRYTLGVTPGRATTLYRIFEELGGVEALSPGKAEKWQGTLWRLAGKFDLVVFRGLPGLPECRHPIGFVPIEDVQPCLE